MIGTTGISRLLALAMLTGIAVQSGQIVSKDPAVDAITPASTTPGPNCPCDLVYGSVRTSRCPPRP